MTAQSKIIIFLFATTVFFAALYFHRGSEVSDADADYKEKIAIAKERIRQLEGMSKRNHAVIDSLTRASWRLDSLLDLQSRNEELIKKKYDTKRNAVRALPADSAIHFFNSHVGSR